MIVLYRQHLRVLQRLPVWLIFGSRRSLITHMQSNRLTRIQHYLYTHGSTDIHALAQAMEISLPTVRRDLQRLEESGVVTRTHGGAMLAESTGTELAFSIREISGLMQKRTIANAAFTFLRPHSAVFLDAGTTVLQLAKRLQVTPLPLTLFTNSLAVAEVLFGVEPVQVFMLGGRLRHENKCVVGPLAEQAIEGLWFDQLYLGGSAVQPDNTVATPDGDEARLNASMLRRSTEHVLLVDGTKFGRHATYRVGALSEMSHIVTDQGLSETWRARLQQMDIPHTLVEGDEGEG